MAQVPGVVSTRAGYTGGRTEGVPNYETVTAGDGHSEAVRVQYDPDKISYDEILTAFWQGHEPRWPVRRKARSVVWYHDEAQRAAAEAHPLRHEHTDIEEVMTWTDAEEDHQLLGVGGNPGNFDLSKLERSR